MSFSGSNFGQQSQWQFGRVLSNMQSEQLFKDVTELHARLLDHRPALSGHINAFVKEFEEKRGNREDQNLKRLYSTMASMTDRLLPESQAAMDAFLINLTAKMKVATEVCRKIEEKEANVDTQYLVSQRERRAAEWDQFMQVQFEKSKKVDDDFDEEVERLKVEYRDLEERLMAPPVILPPVDNLQADSIVHTDSSGDELQSDASKHVDEKQTVTSQDDQLKCDTAPGDLSQPDTTLASQDSATNKDNTLETGTMESGTDSAQNTESGESQTGPDGVKEESDT